MSDKTPLTQTELVELAKRARKHIEDYTSVALRHHAALRRHYPECQDYDACAASQWFTLEIMCILSDREPDPSWKTALDEVM